MRWQAPRLSLLIALVCVAGCMPPDGAHCRQDDKVGQASQADGSAVEVAQGLAAVHVFTEGYLELWAQSPVLHLSYEVGARAPATLRVRVRNIPADAVLWPFAAAEPVLRLPGTRPTVGEWLLPVSPGQRLELEVAPPDGAAAGDFAFGVLSDIQEALDRFGDFAEPLEAEAGLRFVISTGDLARNGTAASFRAVQAALEALPVPFYSTIGNHDLPGVVPHWGDIFGRTSFHFRFKGVAFSLLDTATASLDGCVYEALQGWLAASRGGLHVVAMHIPPFDPVGTRSGAFRSRREGLRLLNTLGAAGVDMTFYGHLHTAMFFANGGIPAWISGGGGAIEERMDGIGRHYLRVDVGGVPRDLQVAIRRIE